ncbi:glycosyltransferase [Yoonia sp. BS5-3]|uniref:Glycosyltransferase n=1 Tax=Yoonia phaeophyticola TaxID=3137369 RepID=A0ABZ2V867_9RHOB
MNILHVTPAFYPATYWGGPIWSTKAICDGIAGRGGFDVRVLTTDAAGPAITARVAPQSFAYPVHYARRIAGHAIAPGLLRKLIPAIGWADVIHLTATYNFPTLPTLMMARLAGKPVVWSPRGALQATASWSDAPRRRIKHLFEKGANVLRPASCVLHVTSSTEAAESTQRLGAIETALIPNSVPIPEIVPVRPDDGHLRLLYLGRLHPKKGLDLLIAAMKALPTQTRLDIYGTGDPVYVASLKAQIGDDARIVLHGHADDDRKARAFAKADLFVLPSHSENFGIAVAEALAHGVPVITTTATPWSRVDIMGCGRCITLGRDDLAETIKALPRDDLPAMGLRGRAWMRREFSPQAMTDAFADLYRSLISADKTMVLA